ncbi:twin-arginine translocation signal domain-containing protein [Sulfitobacter sediminilitoris]
MRGKGWKTAQSTLYENHSQLVGGTKMPKLTRRGFIAATAAAGVVRTVPSLATKPPARRILTLVYDKSLAMMRAIDRLVP